MAAGKGNVDEVRKLLGSGVDVNETNCKFPLRK